MHWSHILNPGLELRGLSRKFGPPVLLLAAFAFAYWSLLDYDPFRDPRNSRDDAEAFLFSVRGGSAELIFLVAAFLLFNRRVQIVSAFGAPALRSASVLFLATAVVLRFWSHFVGAADLSVVSLILAILGAGSLLGGARGLGAVAIPALFLLLLVPLPAVLINQVLFPLQLQTAIATVWILDLLGIPNALMADRISTGKGLFQVIESCSGLRTIETVTMASIVYVELFNRRGAHALLLVVSAPLIGILANQARVLSLVLVPSSAFAAIHTAQGLAMVVAGVCFLVVVDNILARTVPKKARSAPVNRARRAAFPRVAALIAVMATMGCIAIWVPPWNAPRSTSTPLFSLKPTLGDWAARGLKVDREYLGIVWFSEWIHREYTRGTDSIDVFVGTDEFRDRRYSLRSGKTGTPGSGYVLKSSRQIELDPGGPTATVSIFSSQEGPWLVYHWYEGVRSIPGEAIRSMLAVNQLPFGADSRAFVVRLTTPIGPHRSGLETAELRLRSFLPLLRVEIAALQSSNV